MLDWNFILTIKWYWGTTESQRRCHLNFRLVFFCFKVSRPWVANSIAFFAVSANLFRLCKRFVCSLIIDILTAVQGILHPNKRGLEPNMSIWKHWAHSLKIDINYLNWVIYQVWSKELSDSAEPLENRFLGWKHNFSTYLVWRQQNNEYKNSLRS